MPKLENNLYYAFYFQGKEDFGYIFEFQFEGTFSSEPLELVPIRALEILTTEIIPVLSMQYR